MSNQKVQVIRCYQCHEYFYPYGNGPVSAPSYDTAKCPHCGYANFIIYDEQLRKEVARKQLGLDDKFSNEIKDLQIENKSLRIEVESLREKVKENKEQLDALKVALDSLIPAVRKQVAEAITNILAQAKPQENPLAE